MWQACVDKFASKHPVIKKIIMCTVTSNYILLTSACFIVLAVKMTVNFTRKFGSSHEQIAQFDHFVTQHYPTKLSKRHCSVLAW